MSNNGQPMSIKQQRALDEFKVKVADLIEPEHDDFYLTKWLIARSYNVEKAVQMYRTSMAYREKMNVKQIRESYKPPEVIEKYLTGGYVGYDLEGSPLRVELFGLLDMKGIMCSCRKSDLEKTKIIQCEHVVDMWKQQTEKLGRRISGITVIFDMDKVTTQALWRPGLQMYLHLVKVLEDNYPEMMKRMFVINAPRIFPLLWKICRPLISEDMKNKIHVVGADYKTHLLKYVSSEELPACYGGTKTDPDGNPRCATKVAQGGEVPREYYLCEATETEGLTEAQIAKGDTLRVTFDVEQPGTLLRWEFRSEDYDIGFGVVRVGDKSSKDIVVVPVERFNAHQVTHDGCVTCDNIGTYAVVFDNSYSWSRSKHIRYLVELHNNDSVTTQEVDMVSGGGSWTRLVNNMQITHL